MKRLPDKREGDGFGDHARSQAGAKKLDAGKKGYSQEEGGPRKCKGKKTTALQGRQEHGRRQMTNGVPFTKGKKHRKKERSRHGRRVILREEKGRFARTEVSYSLQVGEKGGVVKARLWV